jgi:hypothetical protein
MGTAHWLHGFRARLGAEVVDGVVEDITARRYMAVRGRRGLHLVTPAEPVDQRPEPVRRSRRRMAAWGGDKVITERLERITSEDR